MRRNNTSDILSAGRSPRSAGVSVFLLVAWLAGAPAEALGQGLSVRGEASLAGTLRDADGARREVLARYLPEISFGFSLSESVTLDFSGSANLWAYGAAGGSGSDPSRSDADPYRAWLRFSAPRFEVRAGLQKISFGSANLFRPLMWFDRVDPRDPLQLTEGVWGALGRFYLPGNVTGWGWVVRGEYDRKGWEIVPTLAGTAEGGGRIQLPLGPGEIAGTYNRRRIDVGSLGVFPVGTLPSAAWEDRFAVDGKWDLELGVWVEAVFTRQQSEAFENEWSRAVSFGADYTFDIGNGLTMLAEHLSKENPSFKNNSPQAGDGMEEGEGSPAEAAGFFSPELRLTSFTANYPLGVLDRVALAVYRDWESAVWYRLLEWRRTYDRWRLHLLAFWNDEEGSIFPANTGENEAISGSLAGRGAQLIVVFNH